VTGQLLDAARTDLSNKGFQPEVSYVTCQATPTNEVGKCGPDSIGKVIDTNPKPGTRMNKQDKLTLIVGKAPDKITVPNVVGTDPNDAKTQLEAAGLTVDPTFDEEETDDDDQVGKVIGQNPAATTQADPGTKVKLTIGKAKENEDVPNVVGKSFDDAKAQLENAGFGVNRQDQDSDKPKDQVIAQNPTGKQDPGTTITLTVSKGQNNDDDTILMPDVTGMSPQDARQTLRGLGWTGRLNDQPGQTTDVSELGKIIEQDKEPNSRIKKDEEVGVIVATSVGTGG
jgi:serine/threonine-protein kinase